MWSTKEKIFFNRMTELHCRHLQTDIDQYKRLITEKMVDKLALKQKMVDKNHFDHKGIFATIECDYFVSLPKF